MLLLPEAVDVFGSDNPGASHHAFVDGLDLQATVFARVAAKTTGRPGYAPSDLLKLYIYGYLNRVRSSRRLEAEARRNIEVFGCCVIYDRISTIADFRRDNRTAFRRVFAAAAINMPKRFIAFSYSTLSFAGGARNVIAVKRHRRYMFA